jgi:hypothetical protein
LWLIILLPGKNVLLSWRQGLLSDGVDMLWFDQLLSFNVSYLLCIRTLLLSVGPHVLLQRLLQCAVRHGVRQDWHE